MPQQPIDHEGNIPRASTKYIMIQAALFLIFLNEATVLSFSSLISFLSESSCFLSFKEYRQPFHLFQIVPRNLHLDPISLSWSFVRIGQFTSMSLAHLYCLLSSNNTVGSLAIKEFNPFNY